MVELEPRPLTNLLAVDEIDSLCPVLDSKLLELERGSGPCRARSRVARPARARCAPSRAPRQ